VVQISGQYDGPRTGDEIGIAKKIDGRGDQTGSSARPYGGSRRCANHQHVGNRRPVRVATAAVVLKRVTRGCFSDAVC
jgi:hypothetical protein